MSLVDSLYQESFTRKGSLLFELIPLLDQEEEGWDFYDKGGRLYLKGNPKSLLWALTYLSLITPEEALRGLGKHSLPYTTRALMIEEKIILSDALAFKILQLGFNILVGDYEPKNIHGLEIISYQQYSKDHPLEEGETSQDAAIKALKEMEMKQGKSIFITDDDKGFSELSFEAKNSLIAFEGDIFWKSLKQFPTFGAKLLPVVRGCYKDGSLPLIEKDTFARIISRMRRHPYAGLLVKTPKLPEKGTFLEANLFVAAFCQIVDVPVEHLYELWFTKHSPSYWNLEAITLFDGAARRLNDGEETKAERQKIQADFTLLQEKWPGSHYAETSKKL